MRYSEWNKLDINDRKDLAWHRHPHIRTAKIFTLLFILIIIVVIFGINKSSVVHLNRKPTDKEAFNMAKIFIKDDLKQPGDVVFPTTAITNKIEPENNYFISGTIKTEDMSGKMNLKTWTIKMHYINGDWSDKNSWQVSVLKIQQ